MLRPLPAISPSIRSSRTFARGLSARSALDWLAAGWRDLRAAPGPSLAYGLLIFLLSVGVIAGLWYLKLLYLARSLPMPAFCWGCWFCSGCERRICSMLSIFGLSAFPGAAEAFANLLNTPQGWALLVVGSGVGAIFAAFAFAISLFAIPMMLERRVDALTAMGLSFAMTVQNLPVVLAWGAIVATGLALCLVTGFVALIVIFPVLGHGTWHVWRAIAEKAID